MKYLNQLEYPHIPYPTGLDLDDSRFQKATIKEAGCGLCCLSMMVDQLTTKELPLEECIALSQANGANREIGTNMKILAPVVVEKFDLQYSTTDSIETALDCLHAGGRVICNVGGDRDDGAYVGLFSHGGHYILLVSENAGRVCVMDPSWREDKFQEPGREGKVSQDGVLVYCTTAQLARDSDNRSPAFYLFARNSSFLTD